ncbi:hypothetical protein MNB_SUP05-SYMBIONT-5-23 [hydrothermal vent metagenome]|uniref:Uncharacterized protein n=1 Tax=hydrothermal vent metagenome TaxID=652676 RepID=A0A1W1E5D0_9ZZZZ
MLKSLYQLGFVRFFVSIFGLGVLQTLLLAILSVFLLYFSWLGNYFQRNVYNPVRSIIFMLKQYLCVSGQLE